MRCLLVNPEYPETYWSLRHMLPLVRRRWLVAPLPLLTVAALLPRSWELRLVDLCVAQLLRQVAGEDVDLGLLLVGEILPRGLLELGDRLAALLDHLLEHRQDVGVGELDALVDFALLDGRKDEADGRQARLILGAHRRLHVFRDLVLEGDS